MADHPSKTKWEAENVIKLMVKVNRNQDPELYELFTGEQGSKSTLAKQLMREIAKAKHQKFIPAGNPAGT